MLKAEPLQRLHAAKCELEATLKKLTEAGLPHKVCKFRRPDYNSLGFVLTVVNEIITALGQDFTETDDVQFQMCKTLDATQQCVVQLGDALTQLHLDFAKLKEACVGQETVTESSG